MSRIWMFASFVLILFLLSGCGSPEPEIVIETVVHTREVEVEVPVTQIMEVEVTREMEVEVTRLVEVEVTRLVERVVTATPRPTPRPTRTPDAPELGTRQNPSPVGTATSLVLNGALEFEVTVVEVIRGDAAFQRIIAANQFNDPPPEGFEFVLVLVRAEYTGPDEGILELSKSNFAVVTRGRAIRYGDTFTYSPCCLEPDLEFSLFPEGVAEGLIALPVDIEDTNPLLALGLQDDGDGIFFSLTP